MVATACHGVASADVCLYLDEPVAVVDFFKLQYLLRQGFSVCKFSCA